MRSKHSKPASGPEALLEQGRQAFEAGRPQDAIPLLAGYLRLKHSADLPEELREMLGRAYAERGRQRLRSGEAGGASDLARAAELGAIEIPSTQALLSAEAAATGEVGEAREIGADASRSESADLRRVEALRALAAVDSTPEACGRAIATARENGLEVSDALAAFLAGEPFEGEPQGVPERLAAAVTALEGGRKRPARKALEGLDDAEAKPFREVIDQVYCRILARTEPLPAAEALQRLRSHHLMGEFWAARVGRARELAERDPGKALRLLACPEVLRSDEAFRRIFVPFLMKDSSHPDVLGRAWAWAGQRELARGEVKRAIELWRFARRSGESDPWLVQNLAVATLENRELEAAAEAWTDFAESFQKCPPRLAARRALVERQLVEVLLEGRDADRALPWLRKMKARACRDEVTGEWLMLMALRADELELAADVSRRLIQKFGETLERRVAGDVAALCFDVLRLVRSGQLPGEVAQVIQRARELRSACREIGSPPDSVKAAVERLIEIADQSTAISFDLATELAELILALDGSRDFVLFTLASELLDEREVSRARVLLRRYCEVDPKDWQRYGRVASLLLEGEQAKLARRYIERFERFPDVAARALTELAADCWLQGLEREGRRLLRRAVSEYGSACALLAILHTLLTSPPHAFEVLDLVPIAQRGSPHFLAARAFISIMFEEEESASELLKEMARVRKSGSWPAADELEAIEKILRSMIKDSSGLLMEFNSLLSLSRRVLDAQPRIAAPEGTGGARRTAEPGPSGRGRRKKDKRRRRGKGSRRRR